MFAYGATGSGKTYTMLGDRKNPGVIVRVLNDLFRDIGNKSVQMSYMEIYNETIRDLLVRRSKKLPLRAAGRDQVEVAGLTKTRVRTLSDAMHLLAEGNGRRRTEGTAANAVSSRSHAILMIRIGPKAKLNFIDLAGSERASQTQNRNTRLREGARINRSLLSLANCTCSDLLSLSLTFQLIQKIFKNVLGRKNSETPCGDDLIDDCRVLSLFVERKWVLLCV